MKLIEGKILNALNQNDMIEYLRSRKEEVIEAYTQDITMIKQDNQILLFIKGINKSMIYPVRKAFLHKLLKWYNISHHSIKHFSDETLLMVCNDNLKAISNHNKYVNLKVENNEVVSIVSQKFALSSDLEIINMTKAKFNIEGISRDDFCMRIITKVDAEVEPIVGDVSGFGLSIVNSETGFATLKVEHYILRYWCTNGCTTTIKHNPINIVHYNISKEEIYKDLSLVLDSAPKEPEGFIEGVTKSLNEAALYSFPNITYKVNSIIGSQLGYSFFNDFDKSGTKYDLFNHITHTAKKFDIMERYQLEKLGGNIIC